MMSEDRTAGGQCRECGSTGAHYQSCPLLRPLLVKGWEGKLYGEPDVLPEYSKQDMGRAWDEGYTAALAWFKRQSKVQRSGNPYGVPRG